MFKMSEADRRLKMGKILVDVDADVLSRRNRYLAQVDTAIARVKIQYALPGHHVQGS